MRNIVEWLKARFEAQERKAAPTGLPKPLLPYIDAIEATRQPILAADVASGPPSRVDGSQLGGRPWWPADRPLPTDNNGKPLFLLIQINLSKLPELDPLPTEGLLQFFISSDDHYGANFDNPKSTDGFACVYHETTDAPHHTDFESLKLGKDDYLPLENPFEARALMFTKRSMPVDPTDYRFDALLPTLAAATSDDYELLDAYGTWCAEAAIRLGGYPSFTQEDPRAYKPNRDLGDFNLLTIDTTGGIMWGDVGTAQFFAHEDDIRQRDFSKVAYNWDCH